MLDHLEVIRRRRDERAYNAFAWALFGVTGWALFGLTIIAKALGQ